MGQSFKCAIGCHHWEVYKEVAVLNNDDEKNIAGYNIVNRCKDCGKIESIFIPAQRDILESRGYVINQTRNNK